MRRIVKISTSETMMIDGARRLRTANFMARRYFTSSAPELAVTPE
jgi:hypothetical protein